MGMNLSEKKNPDPLYSLFILSGIERKKVERTKGPLTYANSIVDNEKIV